MARELYHSGSSYLPAAYKTDTSQQRYFTGADPNSMADVTLATNDRWFVPNNLPDGGGGTDRPGFTLIWDEEWTGSSPDAAKWSVYNNSNFGSPQRIQIYKTANVIISSATTGGTGNSIKLRSIETDAGSGTLPTAGNNPGTRYSYTAGMLDTKTAGWYLPRYNYIECKAKIPHGQGIWPALWYTCRLGGATTCEVDLIEYFCSQLPGHNKTSVHGQDNNGTFTVNRVQMYTGQWFENPTATPGWNTWGFEIVPVTSAGGTVLASPTAISNYVRFRTFLNGVQVASWVDTSATYWTTNGGSEDSFWNIYFQGSQIDGNWVGHPRSPLGYDHERDACILSGTPPNSCATTYPYGGGHNDAATRASNFVAPSADFEVDYIKVYKFTG